MSDIESTDEILAARAQEGDLHAFGELVGRYTDKIRRYGMRYFGDADDREDHVQKVFIKAYTNLQSFDTKRRFSPWIYRIAHNEFVNVIKRRSRYKIQSLFDFDLDVLLPQGKFQESVEDTYSKQELRESLEASMDELDRKYKDPLVLYYFEELSYEEIANILEIPKSTVGVRLRRGRDKLKTLIEKTDA